MNFVSGIKDAVAIAVVDYLYKHCHSSSGLMVFRRIPEVPGYEIIGLGDTERDLLEISGLQLVAEKKIQEDNYM